MLLRSEFCLFTGAKNENPTIKNGELSFDNSCTFIVQDKRVLAREELPLPRVRGPRWLVDATHDSTAHLVGNVEPVQV